MIASTSGVGTGRVGRGKQNRESIDARVGRVYSRTFRTESIGRDEGDEDGKKRLGNVCCTGRALLKKMATPDGATASRSSGLVVGQIRDRHRLNRSEVDRQAGAFPRVSPLHWSNIQHTAAYSFREWRGSDAVRRGVWRIGRCV